MYYNIDDRFFESPIEYLEYDCDIYKEDLEGMPDDYTLEAYECKLESMQQVDAYTFIDCIDEERFSEDKKEEDALIEIFNKYINFELINREIPKLWYPTKVKMIWTKQELLSLY